MPQFPIHLFISPQIHASSKLWLSLSTDRSYCYFRCSFISAPPVLKKSVSSEQKIQRLSVLFWLICPICFKDRVGKHFQAFFGWNRHTAFFIPQDYKLVAGMNIKKISGLFGDHDLSFFSDRCGPGVFSFWFSHFHFSCSLSLFISFYTGGFLKMETFCSHFPSKLTAENQSPF